MTNRLPHPYRSIVTTSEHLSELVQVRAQARSGEARAIRLAAGLSVGEIARAVGVASVTVWRWENGQRAPRSPAAERYARVLNRLAQEHAA